MELIWEETDFIVYITEQLIRAHEAIKISKNKNTLNEDLPFPINNSWKLVI